MYFWNWTLTDTSTESANWPQHHTSLQKTRTFLELAGHHPWPEEHMNVPYMSLEHVHMPLQCFFSMEGKGAVTLAHFFSRLLRVQKTEMFYQKNK